MHNEREGGSAFGGSALKARPAPCLLHDHHDRGGRRVRGTGSRRTVWTMPCRPSGGGKGEQQSPEFRLHANGQDVVSLAFLHERPLASVRPPPPASLLHLHAPLLPYVHLPPCWSLFVVCVRSGARWCAGTVETGGARAGGVGLVFRPPVSCCAVRPWHGAAQPTRTARTARDCP